MRQGKGGAEIVNLLESISWVYSSHEIILCCNINVGVCGKRERFLWWGRRRKLFTWGFFLTKKKNFDQTCDTRRVDCDYNDSFLSVILDWMSCATLKIGCKSVWLLSQQASHKDVHSISWAHLHEKFIF